MSTTMDFEEELEVFRTEEEVAQQYFFAYLSVRSLAASSKDVLANMNTTPLFWRTTHHAMLVAASWPWDGFSTKTPSLTTTSTS